MRITLYHNPHCSKSRAVLSLLMEQKADIEIIEYLKTPLTPWDLREILEKLGGPVEQLVRKSEKEYQALNLIEADDNRLIEAIAEHPSLMQRPIIVSKDRVIIGRPPEKVLAIL